MSDRMICFSCLAQGQRKLGDRYHKILDMDSGYRTKILRLICCCAKKSSFCQPITCASFSVPARICSAGEDIRAGALESWGQEHFSRFAALQRLNKHQLHMALDGIELLYHY